MEVTLVLIASKSGGIILERWARYDSAVKLLPSNSLLKQQNCSVDSGYDVNSKQKGEILSRLHSTAKTLLEYCAPNNINNGSIEGEENEHVMSINGFPVIFVPVGDTIFYYVGSEDVDEMQCKL